MLKKIIGEGLKKRLHEIITGPVSEAMGLSSKEKTVTEMLTILKDLESCARQVRKLEIRVSPKSLDEISLFPEHLNLIDRARMILLNKIDIKASNDEIGTVDFDGLTYTFTSSLSFSIEDISLVPKAILHKRKAQLDKAISPEITKWISAGAREIPGIKIKRNRTMKVMATDLPKETKKGKRA